jgi:hypothetical protein
LYEEFLLVRLEGGQGGVEKVVEWVHLDKGVHHHLFLVAVPPLQRF